MSVVYAGTEPSNLYRSEDGGETWQLLPELRQLPSEPRWSFPPRPWTHHVSTIALHPTDPDSLVRRDRARRRDALGRRRPNLDRPQPAGAQRRPPARDAPARARARVRGRGTGDRGLARSRSELAPAGRRARSALRVGDRGRSGRSGPVVRVGEPLPVRRPRPRRRPGAAAALAAATAGRRSTAGATSARAADAVRAGGAARASRAGCWSGYAADRCSSRGDAGETWSRLEPIAPDVIALAVAPA